MEPTMRRAWVEIDLGALRRNGAALAARAGVPLLPVIKADAYGLGARRVAHALEPLSPWGYGVATVDEGVELRVAGIARPILVLSPLLPEEFSDAGRAELRPSLGSAENIRAWGTRGPWHLAIDTGMNRAGIPWQEVAALRPLLATNPPEGAYTHFHSADIAHSTMVEQEQRFRAALSTLPVRPTVVHAENSPAVERYAPSPWDVVRPGVFLYGANSGDGLPIVPEPVAHVRARVVALRTIGPGDSVSYGATFRSDTARRIATVSSGYADGYRRALGNRGFALLRGKRVAVVGVVTMDMTMLDVTDVACEIGDVATLIGRDGDDMLTVNEVAAWAGLIPYELLTGLKLRMPRRYTDGS
jgi:alanine racemase